MKLISKVEIPEYEERIDYKHKLLFLGSCFSGNIGNKFSKGLFTTKVNPFGVIFNPISIFTLIERAMERRYYTADDWIFENDRYINLELHGDFSFFNLDEALNNSNKVLDEVYSVLSTADYLFLTFGTAWVYEYIERNKVVANCHKIPQKSFSKRLLSVDEIYNKAESTLNKLKQLNSQLKIVFTVSPVRHLADGAHANNLSKSSLLLAIEKIEKEFNSLYFPSYEIVLDELRDYRFFDADLQHPNSLATEYVWEVLFDSWFSENSKKIYDRIIKLRSSSLHRPFNVNSAAHQKFIKKSIEKLDLLKGEFAIDGLDTIRKVFESQIK